jgi:membrane protease YdiL (CAAX protease family)
MVCSFQVRLKMKKPEALSVATNRFLPFLLLVIMASLPAVATWISFYLEICAFLLYPFAKVVLFLLPFAVWRLRGQSWRAGVGRMDLQPPRWRGLLSGGLLSMSIWGAYLFLQADLDGAGIRRKLLSLGILDAYWRLSFFILVVNAAFEEWYWRGFLLDELRNRVKHPALIIGWGALFFGFHHYFTLRPYFPLALTLLFTWATMVAGGIWSWHRLRGWSLTDCYVSHLCVDLTVLILGAILLF